MSIERAERLKELLTDKYVVVDSDVPELKRFQNWTGQVRTVNMSCRALVEFDGPADIGWYDIDPDYLKIVDAPIKKVEPPIAKPVPAETPAVPKEVTAAEVLPAPKPASAGKSPLDLIRAQQAAKAKPAVATAPPASDPPSPAPTPEAVAPKLSPLELIRKQQAAKAAKTSTAPATVPDVVPPPQPVAEPIEPTQAVPQPEVPPVATNPLPTTGGEGKPLSKLDLIRMQGPKKK